MMSHRNLLGRALVACLISGLICGLANALQCRAAESDCQIAALQALSSETVSWTLWLHWINWLPGVIFGLLFGLATVSPSAFYVRRLVLFSVASAGSYVAAMLLFSVLLKFASGDEFARIVWIGPAGLAAGLLGALLLQLSASAVVVPTPGTVPSAGRLLLSGAVGAAAGTVFVFICSYGEQFIEIALPLAFAQWQVAVGWTLLPRRQAPRRSQSSGVQA